MGREPEQRDHQRRPSPERRECRRGASRDLPRLPRAGDDPSLVAQAVRTLLDELVGEP